MFYKKVTGAYVFEYSSYKKSSQNYYTIGHGAAYGFGHYARYNLQWQVQPHKNIN